MGLGESPVGAGSLHSSQASADPDGHDENGDFKVLAGCWPVGVCKETAACPKAPLLCCRFGLLTRCLPVYFYEAERISHTTQEASSSFSRQGSCWRQSDQGQGLLWLCGSAGEHTSHFVRYVYTKAQESSAYRHGHHLRGQGPPAGALLSFPGSLCACSFTFIPPTCTHFCLPLSSISTRIALARLTPWLACCVRSSRSRK